MPRLLHLADVHLGARHRDLGEAAIRQRERQLAAFRRAIDVAIEQRVDAVLICGDLFDSNGQPRRTVEQAVGELRRLADKAIRVVLIPGTHDCYDEASLYRVFDLRQMAGLLPTSDLITVLTPEHGEVVFPDLDLLACGRVFGSKSAVQSPLAGFSVAHDSRARWRVGMIHGSLVIPGRVESDDILFTEAEVAASGLDYLALGHWHSFLTDRAGSTTWAYSGATEPVAVDQDGAGQVALVTLDERAGAKEVRVERVTVGRTRFGRLDIDATEIGSQEVLVARLRAAADPDLVLDVRLIGVAGATLDIDPEDVARQLEDAFFRVSIRNLASPALPHGPAPPPDTVAGIFTRTLERRIEAARAAGDTEAESEAAEVLRLGRLLLDDPQRVVLV
jgi:DNA repair exonuclease SbcCD nuclease subunit